MFLYIIILKYNIISPSLQSLYVHCYKGQIPLLIDIIIQNRPFRPSIHPLNPPLRCFYLQEEVGEWADSGPVTAAFCPGYLQCQTGKSGLKNNKI